MNYRYLLYGLKVESELEIEEAYKMDFDTEPDVRIVLGNMPEDALAVYPDKGIGDSFLATKRDALIFRVPYVSDYYVTRDVITVHPLRDNLKKHEINCFILGSCFGFCMVLRRQVMLHGGAVSKDGKGVIVTGESGAGKSTITDVLLDSGYMFVADDTCAIYTDSDRPHIAMGYPQQKLCRDAAVRKGYDLNDLIYINEDRDKFARRLTDGYLVDGSDFNSLYEIVLSDDENLYMNEVTGAEKLMTVIRNVFRGEGAFDMWGLPPEYMKICLKISSAINVYRIARPKDKNTVPEIIDFIEKTMGGCK